jgi:hypothetical protein
VGSFSFSQEMPSIKFGKVSEADLRNRSYAIDTGANAVVIANVGTTKIVGNSKGFVSLESREYKRIHILKNAGYDLATVEIPLYKEDDLEEELKDLKAVTYNLENGKVVETKLNEKSSVFKEKIDGNRVIMKFTLPNVKEGSIIEYDYKIISDYLFNLQPWYFQSEVPHLWSQYTVEIPQFLDYMLVEYVNHPYYGKDEKLKNGQYFVDVTKDVYRGVKATDRLDITCDVSVFRWTMKDVPALKEEPYVSSYRNYIDRLEFQLAGYLPPLIETKIMTTWPDMTQRLLEKNNFGKQLTNNDYWVNALLEKIQTATTQTSKAQHIYNYVKDNFKCTGYHQVYTNTPLNKVASSKSGGIAEINLLLTALLRGAGLQADPVILSTRENGLVNNEFPVMKPFNYVICRVTADGKELLLDASHPQMGFGKLHYDCYNGSARVVNNSATLINLKPDQLTEKKQTTLFIYRESNGRWTGYAHKLYGYYGSEKLREKIAVDGMAGLQKELVSAYGNELKIDSVRVDSLQNFEEPVTVHYVIKNENEADGIIYMNPVLGEKFKQNPFKSTDRKYPIELPFKQIDLYTLNMEIPTGYIVDELPKPVSLKLNAKNDAVFEYKIAEAGGVITMNYKLELNRTQFLPADYNLIREFFSNVVAKLDEQIVLKKK